MKKILFYMQALWLVCLLPACGGNQNNTDGRMDDTDTIEQNMDTTTYDLRQDTTDTMGMPTPTPVPPTN